MLKRATVVTLVCVALAVPASVLAVTPLERTLNAGWSCADIAGAIHCFDPGDARSSNAASVNVRVFDYDGSRLGTEQLWNAELYAGQPCPQDALIDLGAFIACHHYPQ